MSAVMESQPERDSSPQSENTLVAVGRKVKSAFSTDQEPSIRIFRGSTSTRPQHGIQGQPAQAQPADGAPGNGIGSSFRSFFSRNTEPRAAQSTEEYDAETVDVLDVVGRWQKGPEACRQTD